MAGLKTVRKSEKRCLYYQFLLFRSILLTPVNFFLFPLADKKAIFNSKCLDVVYNRFQSLLRTYFASLQRQIPKLCVAQVFWSCFHFCIFVRPLSTCIYYQDSFSKKRHFVDDFHSFQTFSIDYYTVKQLQNLKQAFCHCTVVYSLTFPSCCRLSTGYYYDVALKNEDPRGSFSELHLLLSIYCFCNTVASLALDIAAHLIFI